MSELKSTLVQLTEAYAAAKSTDNELLQRLITEKFKAFLDNIEVVSNQTETKETEVLDGTEF